MPRVAVYVVLPLVIVLAAVTRWTEADVTLRLSGATYDEAVYATSARLFLHGILPYRDFFFGHPPVGAFIFSPAMLLDSTAWGGPNAFAAARQLSLDYGLISVALAFAVGYRLTGLWGAIAASLVWSLDPRAVGLSTQVILDGPMVMFSFAALLAYLTVHPGLAPDTTPRRQVIGLVVAGGLATLGALTKAVGVTVLMAILIDLAWQRFRPGTPKRGLVRNLGSVFAGTAAASSVALLPFVIAAPRELIRQAVFFQLLRPRTQVSLTERIGALAHRPEYWPILIAAGLGLVVLLTFVALPTGLRMARRQRGVGDFKRPPLAGWSVILLWAAANTLLFAWTPRIEPHYQLHVIAALALIAAGVGLIPLWLESVPRAGMLLRRWELLASLLVLGALTVQQAPAWSRPHHGSGTTSYGRVSNYISLHVASTAHLLVLDARVTFIAGREPNHGATGYLADPYGHLLYLGLELKDRGLFDLTVGVIRREKNSYGRIARSPLVQTDLLARFAETDVVVVNGGELSRIGPAAEVLDAKATDITQIGGYLLYRIDP